MKKLTHLSLVLAVSLIAAAVWIGVATADSETENSAKSAIQYPIKELGSCADENLCAQYCDKPAHQTACFAFAKKSGLMTESEIEQAENFFDAGSGPGGCKSKEACEEYCNSIEHIDVCVEFAEKHGLMSASELAEAKKIKAAIAAGVKAPACTSRKQCDVYCSESDHFEECVTFARQAGFMSPEELKESEQMLAAIKKGAKPPPCKGKEACDDYCSQEEHFNACIDFAVAAGFIDSKDVEMAKKTHGKGPGGCKNKEACDAFCRQAANMPVCAQFSLENGMISKEEYDLMIKTGGKGPGGCNSKEECENFCKVTENQKTCMNFARENGMMSQGDIQRMEQDQKRFADEISKLPPNIYTCLETSIGADLMSKYKTGEAMPSEEIGNKMRECFEKNMPIQSGGNLPPGGSIPPGVIGPGGCTTPEECQTYCQTNPDKCGANMQQPGQPMPGGSGPMTGPGCESGNCPAPSGPMLPGSCEGTNCPQMPPGGQYPGMQPGTQVPMEGAPPGGQPVMPPPRTESAPMPTGPGAGGSALPGEFVPLAPPAEPVPMVPPPNLEPPPPPAPESAPVPTSIYDLRQLFGTISQAFKGFFY